MLYRTIIFALVASAAAQFGKRNIQREAAAAPNDVDIAMAGWEQLSKNPDKMQEVLASFKDPEVMAKAQEMLKDPVYMAAAKKKMEQLQANARAKGMLDSDNNPLQGMAQAAAGAGVPGAMAAEIMGGAAARAQAPPSNAAREWEMANMERHRAGEMNDAELGMANLKNAMQDPSVLGEVAQMLKDPANMQQLKQMMSDPTFMAQAKRVAEQMKASGDLPDFSKMGAMAQQMAQQMGGAGGMGGMGGDAAAEIARLRAENAALRGQGLR